uniref:ATP synthase F0 subunit 8 n=1 Tax=Homoeocerus bipunctatus TaxID=3021836 RepID=UPI00237B7E18|nr:ATP synthase F0 subunit 8 [Homoeocerus bipunctatus]WBV80556.1 ATP synthase F0 subunit 8 [Homoeocerus bipunctatus]
MPQMSPLWWEMLFMFFIISFIIMMMIMFFNSNSLNQKYNKKLIKINQLKWKW